jgi:hypothetical protein
MSSERSVRGWSEVVRLVRERELEWRKRRMIAADWENQAVESRVFDAPEEPSRRLQSRRMAS